MAIKDKLFIMKISNFVVVVENFENISNNKDDKTTNENVQLKF